MTRIANAITEPEEHEEIEVTEEMVEAGIREYALFDSIDPGEWVVSAVFRGMLRAAIEDPEYIRRLAAHYKHSPRDARQSYDKK
jgi:hypothetical protein